MKYQREIDGLRALAVVPVVLHHAHVPWFAGGFLGVDVFFVISGFLITGIVHARIDRGAFSIRDFYVRRLKRLMPALFAVLAFVFVAGLALQPPRPLVRTGYALMAVPLYVSNVHFWQSIDYFNPAAGMLPLLHTWTLAVEEQFYLFLPGMLLLLHRFARRSTRWILLVLGVLSLALAVMRPTSSSFFLLPTRAWELVAGGVLALSPAIREQVREKDVLSEVLALMGFVAVAGSMVLQSTETQTPGLATLFPVIGTVLILLAAKPTTVVGRLLCTRPMVGIGLISYSWYLWHQPVFSFYRQTHVLAPSWWEMGGLGVLSGVMGWLSWRFVEQPFRNPDILPSRVFTGSLIASVATFAAGAALVLLDGVPQRYDTTSLELYATKRPPRDPRRCNWSPGRSLKKLCRHGEGDTVVLLVGDSFAEQYAKTLAAADPTLTVVQLTRHGCAPVTQGGRCEGFGAAVVEAVATVAPDRIVVAANWSGAFNHDPTPGACSEPYHDAHGVEDAGRAAGRDLNSLAALGLPIVVLAEPPQPLCNVPRTEAMRHRRGLNVRRLDRDVVVNHSSMQYLAPALTDDIRVFEFTDVFCDATGCPTGADGELYYYDGKHLSRQGAEKAVAALLRWM